MTARKPKTAPKAACKKSEKIRGGPHRKVGQTRRQVANPVSQPQNIRSIGGPADVRTFIRPAQWLAAKLDEVKPETKARCEDCKTEIPFMTALAETFKVQPRFLIARCSPCRAKHDGEEIIQAPEQRADLTKSHGVYYRPRRPSIHYPNVPATVALTESAYEPVKEKLQTIFPPKEKSWARKLWDGIFKTN